jgi:hypothetical protein
MEVHLNHLYSYLHLKISRFSRRFPGKLGYPAIVVSSRFGLSATITLTWWAGSGRIGTTASRLGRRNADRDEYAASDFIAVEAEYH